MFQLTRSFENPILNPDTKNSWEAVAAFNPSVLQDSTLFHAVFRAQSAKQPYFNIDLSLSTIGYASSPDPIHFTKHRQLISPEYDWEKFGCEDPRLTKMDNRFFIFYTALSGYPFAAENIKTGVAITRDFNTIDEKHPVTPFNAKGIALFPEKINDKYTLILTVDTDKPPAKIGIASFDKLEDIWSPDYWTNWYAHISDHTIDLLRDSSHQIEVGAVPIKTKYGWLIIYANIRDYFTADRDFGIEAALLDFNDPRRVLAKTSAPLLTPREQYESFGLVPYTIFPTSAAVVDDTLYVYYGAADTTGCVATCDLSKLIDHLYHGERPGLIRPPKVRLERFTGNPIISPDPNHAWESKYTFNPTAVYLDDQVHLLYRAQGEDLVSRIGYASLADGLHVTHRLDQPIYSPRLESEKDGCEDARLSVMGNRIYMFYTAYNKANPTHVALTSIKISDFLTKNFNWTDPLIISPKEINDKNACLLSEKINNKYVIFHRTNHMIWVDEIEDLKFTHGRWIQGNILFGPKEGTWYSEKVGIAGPPVKTTSGWLLIFHALSKYDRKYRLGAMLLDLNQPQRVKSFLDYPLLEPDEYYENNGYRPGTVFSCGTVVIKNTLYVYYGGADQFTAVATIKLDLLLTALNLSPNFNTLA